MFYKVIYLNFWGELSTVYQEEKEGAEYYSAGVWIRKEFNPVKNELEIEKLALLMPVRI